MSGGRDGTIRLWHTTFSVTQRTLPGHTGAILSIAFGANGATIASGSGDGTIRVWNAASGQHNLTLEGHTGAVLSVAYSSSGGTLASASTDGTIRLWDAVFGGHRQTLTGYTDYINSVAFSTTAGTLASGSADGTVHLWNTNSGVSTYTLTGHTDWVGSVAFSNDGQMLVSGSNDGTIRLWNVASGEHQQTLTEHADAVRSVRFSPDGSMFASASLDGTIRLWNAATGEHQQTLIGHTEGVLTLAFNRDGDILASGSTDGTIYLWDVASGQHEQTLIGHTDYVRSVAFSPNGGTLASGSDDGTIRLWDTAFGEHQRTLTGHTDYVFSIAYSSDGDTLVSASVDDTIRLWDTISGTQVQTLSGHTSGVLNVTLSPDGETLASASLDGTVLLWNFSPPTPMYATVSFSPSPVQSPAIGEQLTFSLSIADGSTVAGYQATVRFDPSALRFLESTNGDYLPSDAYVIPALIAENTVTLAATSLGREANGSGTLTNVTFEVVTPKTSTLILSDVRLTDSTGRISYARVKSGQVTEPMLLRGDLNGDGVVNVQDLALVAANFSQTGENLADVNGDEIVDIVDLTLVAAALMDAAGAPTAWKRNAEIAFTRTDVQRWLREAEHITLTDPTFQRGIYMLQQLLAALTPNKTALLPNYPNPFNPETWIPYQLAAPADVTLTIYAADGKVVRTLGIGHQSVGTYQDQSRAAYWDGRNELGEPVASGVYFYTLSTESTRDSVTAGDFIATRKMLIMK